MTIEDFPSLFQFLGAYFHEDWMCEFDSADDVVKSFIADSESRELEKVVKEIDFLLAMKISENETRDFLLKKNGCCYCYWNEWQDGNTWLKHISVFISEASHNDI
ncbi:contact-dependent growth inhibition system immunity protein [Pseudomonas fluorescens]|uniref:contact-dependent growth inhibition system immunity protein n=1 Tax=Pseudomonas fluorescens TaxID=294 RepID=UPI002B1E6246|nr:contact-dependent growth inhibition system immunity protein [Pseudomonas fluorescens]